MIKRPEILQDWVTLMGEDGDELAQHTPFCINVTNANKVVVRWDIRKAEGADLYLQTSKILEKKHWRDTKTLTLSDSVVLTREVGVTTEFIENFLRWRVAGTASGWQLTFRIRVYAR